MQARLNSDHVVHKWVSAVWGSGGMSILGALEYVLVGGSVGGWAGGWGGGLSHRTREGISFNAQTTVFAVDDYIHPSDDYESVRIHTIRIHHMLLCKHNSRRRCTYTRLVYIYIYIYICKFL